jgi:hypothetical protein
MNPDDKLSTLDYALAIGAFANEEIQQWYALKTHQDVPGQSLMTQVLGVDPGSPFAAQRSSANTTLLVIGGLALVGLLLFTRR